MPLAVLGRPSLSTVERTPAALGPLALPFGRPLGSPVPGPPRMKSIRS